MLGYALVLPTNKSEEKEIEERIHSIFKNESKKFEYEIQYKNYTIDKVRGAILEKPIEMTQIFVEISNLEMTEESDLTKKFSEIGIGSGFVKLDTTPISFSIKVSEEDEKK